MVDRHVLEQMRDNRAWQHSQGIHHERSDLVLDMIEAGLLRGKSVIGVPIETLQQWQADPSLIPAEYSRPEFRATLPQIPANSGAPPIRRGGDPAANQPHLFLEGDNNRCTVCGLPAINRRHHAD